MSRARKPEPFGPRGAWLARLVADGGLFDWAGVLRRDVRDPFDGRWYTVAEDRLRAAPSALPYSGLTDRRRKARSVSARG